MTVIANMFFGLQKKEASLNEDEVQVPWPAAGKFKYFYAAIDLGAGTLANTWEFILRINGKDSALRILTSTSVSPTFFVSNLSDEVSVGIGDLISIRALNKTLGTQNAVSARFYVSFTASETVFHPPVGGEANFMAVLGAIHTPPNISLGGTFDFSGALTIKQFESLDGTLAFSGALTTVLTQLQSLGGTLDFSGSLAAVLQEVTSLLVQTSSNNGTTTWDTTTNAFRPIGQIDGTSSSAAGNSQARMPIAVKFTNMQATLQAALTGGQIAKIRYNINGSGSDTILLTVATPSTPSVALVATAVGNIDNGTHSWKVTFVIDGFENAPSAASSILTVDGTHKQVNITSIATGPTGTTNRKIYRTVAGNTGNYKLLTTLNDTDTTYTDNTADAGLGADAPTGLFIGSNTGALSVAQDDLVCLEATAFTGATSVSFRNIQSTYTAATADGFFFAHRVYIGSSTNPMGYIHKGGGVGWIPKQLTVNEGTFKADAAPGVGTSYVLTLQKNNGGTNVGTALSLSGTNTSSRITVAGVLPLTTTASNTDNNRFNQSNTGSPASNIVRILTSYILDSPDQKYSLITAGAHITNYTLDNSLRFVPLQYTSTTDPSTANEQNAQFPWPIAGTFKYMGVVHTNSVGQTATVSLRVNGVTSALSIACAGTGARTWTSDFSSTVTVAAGDKVNFAYQRTTGAGAETLAFEIVIGFIAT